MDNKTVIKYLFSSKLKQYMGLNILTFTGITIYPKSNIQPSPSQGQIQDLVKGMPQFFWPIFANSTQWSHVNEVSPYWLGSRACLRALEALGVFITKYAFSPFWGTFLYYF